MKRILPLVSMIVILLSFSQANAGQEGIIDCDILNVNDICQLLNLNTTTTVVQPTTTIQNTERPNQDAEPIPPNTINTSSPITVLARTG